MRRSAVAVLRDGTDEYVLERRPSQGRLLCPGKQSLFGGSVEPEDNGPEDGLLRELREELVFPRGVDEDVKDVRFVWKGKVPDSDGELREVHLYDVTIACSVGSLALHPDLLAEGTGLECYPLYADPLGPVTRFTVQALAAVRTGDVSHLPPGDAI